MNTAVINIKTKPEIKIKAQEVASELGFSISSILNAYLKQLINTRTIYFTSSEEPSEYLINAIKTVRKEIKNNELSPTFKNSKEAIKWLNDN
ncbi:MAG: type II toxin-antitoxin system RelB/DinJ family antitoxin [Patescibacteria group bacterium]